MTTAQGPTPRPTTGRRVVLLGVAVLAAAALAAGAWLRWARPRPAPPVPPEVKADALEPVVLTAIGVARERALKEPASAEAWGDLGKVFLANELQDEANVCFAQAERLDARNPRWPYFQGGTWQSRGDYAAALPFLRRAADLCAGAEADNVVPRLLLAETLLTLGRADEAEAELRQAGDRRPDDARVHYDRGLLAAARQDWPAARDHLRRCLGSPYARQKACVQLAAVSRRLGEAAAAEDFRRQADRLPADLEWGDPFVAEYLHWAVRKRARYRLAEQLEAAGRPADAVAVLGPLARDYPDDYLPHLTVGKLLGQTGDLATAEQALRTARRLAPDKVQVYYYLSLVLFRRGEEGERQGGGDRGRAAFAEAAAMARRAAALKPDYGFAHMALGLALKRLGRANEALAAFRQAVRCNPEFAEMHYHLGEALAESGRAEEARPRLEQALRLAPPGAGWRQAARDLLAGPKQKPAASRPAGP
jgi:tetratricopeptide (TPR) repeat protein